MPAITIVTNGHFSTSPRVWKEADALAAAGLEVEVQGVCFDPRQAALDERMLPGRSWRYVPALDLRPGMNNGWPRFRERAKLRLARGLSAWGVALPGQFGYALGKMADNALRRRADLTIVHLECGLWVGTELARRRLPIGVDIEDWHSENAGCNGCNPQGARLLSKLEFDVLQFARHRTTASHALAAAFAKRSDNSEILQVVRNSTASGAGAGAIPDGPPRLFWFSQTIGRGRGLEALLAALRDFDVPWRLALLGTCSEATRAWLQQALGPRADRLELVAPLPPDELHAETTRHDLGFALEIDRCRNALLTSSNKIFQYLQAGLRVLATDTPGQAEVLAELPNHGAKFPIGDVPALQRLLEVEFAGLAAARQSRVARAAAADAAFGYERSAKVLVHSVREALAKGRA